MNAYRLIDNNISGNNYEKFLQLCFNRATYFSLTFHDTKKQFKIKKELQPYNLKVLRTFHWYCFHSLKKPLTIAIYFANEETRHILSTYYNNIYCEPRFNVEDICFFNDKNLIFGSVSHADCAHLFLSSSEDIYIYEQIAAWKKEYFPDADGISLPI